MKLIAHQDDTLDSLLFRHFGHTRHTEFALTQNKGIAQLPILPMGYVVELPDALPDTASARHKQTVQLWD